MNIKVRSLGKEIMQMTSHFFPFTFTKNTIKQTKTMKLNPAWAGEWKIKVISSKANTPSPGGLFMVCQDRQSTAAVSKDTWYLSVPISKATQEDWRCLLHLQALVSQTILPYLQMSNTVSDFFFLILQLLERLNAWPKAIKSVQETIRSRYQTLSTST